MKLKYLPKKDERFKKSKDDLFEAQRSLQKKLKSKGIRFRFRFVGSGKRKLILVPVKGNPSKLDLDCQIIFTRFGNMNFNELMSLVQKELIQIFKNLKWNKVDFHHRVAVFKNKEKHFLIEMLFLIENPNDKSIYEIVRNVNPDDKSNHKFIKNEAKKYYIPFKDTHGSKQWNFVRDEYKKEREKEWDKPKDEQKSHFAILNDVEKKLLSKIEANEL